MTPRDEISIVEGQRHDQMLRLVAKGFYKELINYGVKEAEVLTVAAHLLDNVLQKSWSSTQPMGYYNQLFTLDDVRNDWEGSRRIHLQEVALSPLDSRHVPQIATWLEVPAIRDSFYPRFPGGEEALRRYFQSPDRAYFAISFQDQMVGLIGADNIDVGAAKLEMKKLVGGPGMQGKGIGKRATFLFLYYAFAIRKFNKVYVHSLDINVRNLNLNSKFGFELEGTFFEEAVVQNQRRDVVRMALAASAWFEIFS